MGFWKRSEEDLEQELRASRYEPTQDFVHTLAKRLRIQHRPRLVFRVGVAAWISAVMLVAFASVGGISQGAAAVRHLFTASVSSVNHATGNGTHHGDNGKCGGDRSNGDRGKKKDCDDENCDNEHGKKRSDCDEYEEEHKKCRKSEDERHHNAEQSEDRRHDNALKSIKSLPKNKQESAKKQEDSTHAANEKAENKRHEDNDKKCEQKDKKK